MKVTVSVYSRFWAFNLAQQLRKHEALNRLITTFPKRETKRFGIPDRDVCSLLPYELLSQASYRLPGPVSVEPFIHAVLHERFDRSVAWRIPEGTELFVGWSGSSEHAIAAARRQGAVTVVVRGSSHIEYQAEILTEEFAQLGVRGSLPDRRTIEKEVREYASADYIDIPSTFVRNSFLTRGVPAEKLIVTPYGVDLREFSPEPKTDTRFRLIYVGTMSLRKGIPYLLRAWSELKLPDADLWLVGPMTDEVKPFFAKYEGSFNYHGYQPQSTLRHFYAQASAFAICSIEEGMALVIAQAMACGLPVICTQNTGGADWFEDGQEGFVVPIRDIEALKEKILYLYENPDRTKTMGDLAMERVRQDYSWDAFGDKYVSTYRTIIDNR